MRIFASLMLFFLISSQLAANSLDFEDKQRITNHFNKYVNNGSLPNISILIKKDNKEILRHTHGYAAVSYTHLTLPTTVSV